MLSLLRIATVLQPFGEKPAGSPPTPDYSLRVSPGRVRPGRSYTIVFSGVSTRWLTNPPSLSHSGVSGLTVGSPTVIDDVTFSVSLITGAATGSIVWAENTYSIIAIQDVSASSPAFVLLPPSGARGRMRGRR